jgi:hypothetical protein
VSSPGASPPPASGAVGLPGLGELDALPRGTRWVVLVEGESDRGALQTLARRLGRDLPTEGTTVVAMGGATNVGHHVRALAQAPVQVAGLYDVAEERFVRRALAAAGLLPSEGGEPPDAGFFPCDADLEDELIRALGVDVVEDVLAAQGDLALFRKFQGQPAQRDRPVERQLHRFLGTTSGRKIAYGHLLAERVDLARTPLPLRRLLDHIRPAQGLDHLP